MFTKHTRLLDQIAFGMMILFASMTSEAVTSLKVQDSYGANGKASIKVDGIIQSSPDAVWSQLIQFNTYSKFMPHVLDSFFISNEGVETIRESMKTTMNPNKMRAIAKPYKVAMPRKKGASWSGMIFMVIDTPFPVENRWYVIRSVQDETKGPQKIYKRCWELVVGNIESANGCWNLEPTETAETLAHYVDNVNPGGNVPEWVSRMGAHQTMPEVFKALETRSLQAAGDIQ